MSLRISIRSLGVWLGFAVLFRDRKNVNENFAILGVMFAVSLAMGYALSAIFNFDILYI